MAQPIVLIFLTYAIGSVAIRVDNSDGEGLIEAHVRQNPLVRSRTSARCVQMGTKFCVGKESRHNGACLGNTTCTDLVCEWREVAQPCLGVESRHDELCFGRNQSYCGFDELCLWGIPHGCCQGLNEQFDDNCFGKRGVRTCLMDGVCQYRNSTGVFYMDHDADRVIDEEELYQEDW